MNLFKFKYGDYIRFKPSLYKAYRKVNLIHEHNLYMVADARFRCWMHHKPEINYLIYHLDEHMNKTSDKTEVWHEDNFELVSLEELAELNLENL